MNRPEAIPASASKARLRLWLALLKTARMIEATVRERLRGDFATTLPRFDVMAALDRAPGGLRMTELSDALRVSNGNVTGIVERLAAEGLVERLPVQGDRRAMRVRLTDPGRDSFAILATEHEGWIDELLAPVQPDRAADLAAELRSLTDHVDALPRD